MTFCGLLPNLARWKDCHVPQARRRGGPRRRDRGGQPVHRSRRHLLRPAGHRVAGNIDADVRGAAIRTADRETEALAKSIGFGTDEKLTAKNVLVDNGGTRHADIAIG
ncbi:hypothetical protein [Streptomyces hydrogenans]|uniref:Uncharacterized protein n=1 Tax=Streptomyces hydrogenans TaxID=1873719 RepID=A0ABQ3P0W7_9ACTN|nr:hypothetical protein [Streptomyces hydrogenans]GHG35459.1 hypothetical protein GCM10018784_56210 [Streptomyces hydrogenans]GHI18672.1 hypothetical protein Shyd_00430 [Streptomyces hydrogenans]GHI20410.1 hypothetical protein Shyd_17810 [Streptomyces hydrogenans]GHI23434.1 hypothetical protein Shyd_48050 [Streptomyces hydrogenans]GHI25409.1 hypothetical protein Shyd_67800 [Streptomyces hydrogenans]